MDIRADPPGPLHFGTWTSMREGVFTVITVDLSLLRTLPRRDLPTLVRLSYGLLTPSPNGMPVEFELNHILVIEERFRVAFADRHRARFTGHIYRGGIYEAYFHAPKVKGMPETLDRVAASLPAGTPPYDMTIAMRRDPEWILYRECLYPNPMGMQSIRTSQVLRTLESQGDDLSKSRRVHHEVLFKTKEQVSEFIGRMRRENFVIDGESEDRSSGEGFAITLWISRVDSVKPREIDYTVRCVFLQGTKCGGRYNGWVTQVLTTS